MSRSAREELERLLQESLGLLRETDWDLGQLQQWGARREEIFAKIDAKILARLEDQCCDLRQKINATDRLRRSYPGASFHAPSLIQRAI
ncbi:MAG: hypothetical protein HYU31_00920 [Deltaproteobacteria bacterium]|nr:hypothetical protein [Deltaproteobacteria bacterium]